MRICHVGHFKIGTVNGNYNALWSLACAQVKNGHNVTIIRVGKPVAQEQVILAREQGIILLGFPCPMWYGYWHDKTGVFLKYLKTVNPDIVHLQYVRIPKLLFISRVLQENGIPYVISLHGGMNSIEMKRKRIRKWLYWHGIEKKVHSAASGIHFVTAQEKNDYYSTLGKPKSLDIVIPNAVEIPIEIEYSFNCQWEHLTFAYFGRYDIWHKGIDLMVELVRHLREFGILAELHLYGSPGDRFGEAMSSLVQENSGVPIYDHGFVDGIQKYQQMAAHDFYLQYSRFELFGISLVEAMALGVPVIVSEKCDLAPALDEFEAAIEIPMNPKSAVQKLLPILKNRDNIKAIAKNGQKWALAYCAPDNIAHTMSSFYQRVLNAEK